MYLHTEHSNQSSGFRHARLSPPASSSVSHRIALIEHQNGGTLNKMGAWSTSSVTCLAAVGSERERALTGRAVGETRRELLEAFVGPLREQLCLGLELRLCTEVLGDLLSALHRGGPGQDLPVLALLEPLVNTLCELDADSPVMVSPPKGSSASALSLHILYSPVFIGTIKLMLDSDVS